MAIHVTEAQMAAVRADIAARAPGAGDVILARELCPKRALAHALYLSRLAAVRLGRVVGGPIPYGYTRGARLAGLAGPLVPVPEEVEVVRFIFRRYLERRSMQKVVDELVAAGKRTRKGKTWSRAGIAWILRNRIYIGMVRLGEVRARGGHVAIVAPAIFYKVGKLVRENDKHRGDREPDVAVDA